MDKPDYQQLVRDLTSDDESTKESARQILFVLDEDAVSPLLDEFYAGVTDVQGIAILDILAHIGGYEALNTLRTLLFFDLSTRPIFRKAAAEGLLQNSDFLSDDEKDKITAMIETLNL